MASPPTQDGSAHGSSTGTTTATATLTTVGTNDMIVAFVNAEDRGGVGSIASITSVSGGGLTWTKRQGISGYSSGTSSHSVTEEWTAPSAGVLTGAVITVTAAFTGLADHVSIIVFGVNGCFSTADPFDHNANAKAQFQDSSNIARDTSNASFAALVSTTTNDTLVVSYFTTMSSATNTSGTGMTQIAAENNAGGTNWDNSTAQFISKSAPVTSFATVFANVSVQNYVELADSFTADAQAAAGIIPASTHAMGFSMAVTLQTLVSISAPINMGFTQRNRAVNELDLPKNLVAALGIGMAAKLSMEVRLSSVNFALGFNEAIALGATQVTFSNVNFAMGFVAGNNSPISGGSKYTKTVVNGN